MAKNNENIIEVLKLTSTLLRNLDNLQDPEVGSDVANRFVNGIGIVYDIKRIGNTDLIHKTKLDRLSEFRDLTQEETKQYNLLK